MISFSRLTTERGSNAVPCDKITLLQVSNHGTIERHNLDTIKGELLHEIQGSDKLQKDHT